MLVFYHEGHEGHEEKEGQSGKGTKKGLRPEADKTERNTERLLDADFAEDADETERNTEFYHEAHEGYEEKEGQSGKGTKKGVLVLRRVVRRGPTQVDLRLRFKRSKPPASSRPRVAGSGVGSAGGSGGGFQ